MTTTLNANQVELSKQLGDFWNSTTDGAGSSTTLVDSALSAKVNDWITDDTWVMLTEEPASAAAIYDERKATSLVASTGILTTLAFAEAPGTGIDYELHRLFSPSEKRRALIYGARSGFPLIHNRVRDENKNSGDWLKDGGMEVWTSTSALTHYTITTVTATQTSTAPYVKRGTYSLKMGTAAGNVAQGVSNNVDLLELAGKTVKLKARGWCNTASCLRLQIYDGTTTTSSDYHAGNSAWTDPDDDMEVEATISDTPTEVTFRWVHDVAAGVSYADDSRVLGPTRSKVFVGDLNLAENKAYEVARTSRGASQYEPWVTVRATELDISNGWLYLPSTPSDFKLRIEGMGYLDFLASGASSTAWTSTININSPQTDILVAEAALYLCKQMIVPNFSTGDMEKWQQALFFWESELKKRKAKFGMKTPDITVEYR